MVFENLTLFEIQLDGAQFGLRTMNGDDTPVDDASTVDVEHAESGGRGRLLPVFMLALLAVGTAALWRRSRSSDFEFDTESETEDAEADLATAQ